MEQLLCTVPDGTRCRGYCNRSDLQFVLASLGWDVDIDNGAWTTGNAVVRIDDNGCFTSNIDLGPVLLMSHEEAVEFVAASEWGKACEHLDYDGD